MKQRFLKQSVNDGSSGWKQLHAEVLNFRVGDLGSIYNTNCSGLNIRFYLIITGASLRLMLWDPSQE